MIKTSEYAKRRKDLMQKVGAKGLVILPSSAEMLRNGDVFYPFRQQSDFYYLTGFEEPEAVLVLAPKRKQGEFILFNRVRDPNREMWDGPRAGQKGACKAFLADQSFPIDELPLLLPELLAGRETIHYPLGYNDRFDKTLMLSVNKLRHSSRGHQHAISFTDIMPTLHEMRVVKSKAEIALMQTAADISAAAHIRAMQACKPGMYEYALEAELLHEFIRHGSRSPAYNTIVGAGQNTCVLHYVANNQKIKNGDLVLIDAGAEYQHYAADITRTFPANGRFSPEQRVIYELVLTAQLAAIKTIKPRASWIAAHNATVKIITQGLVDLGILQGNVNTLIEKQAYFPFYMHRSGHWLGLDVHDVGCYRHGDKWLTLKPGMVLTVEPGIYISAKTKGVHKRWHHIGVRIEDDVLVTATGCEVLSRKAPKTVAEIEAIMAS